MASTGASLPRGGPVFVANDEAHHTHDEDSEWNKGIRRLHSLVGRVVNPSYGAGQDGILLRCHPT